MHQLIICVTIQTKRNKQLSVRRLSQYNQQWLNKIFNTLITVLWRGRLFSFVIVVKRKRKNSKDYYCISK
uniref:Uncharacterized protein n=1 Tax=virus sp. ctiha2 TaxID=2827299 RepID=A0A8S5RGL3_9VIRU|nr:MAG TPA: hypothetical protein [virus sp. ctiha2]DAX13878.1 MAG TPA: hypothetical protein [Bacteriophage sp.]